MDPGHLDRLSDELSGRKGLSLVVRTGTGDNPLLPLLVDLAAEVERATGGAIAAGTGSADGLPGAPALSLMCGERSPVSYLALPEGHQVEPFVEGLIGLADCAVSADASRGPLVNLGMPAALMVFTATNCPNCPVAVRAATRLALDSPLVTATIVDAQRFPELAEKYQVKSVPVTLIDGDLTIIGVVTPEDLAARILGRVTDAYGQQVFTSLIESGRLADAAARVIDGSGGPHFIAAWKRSATMERVPLMVLVEDVLEEDEAALDGLVEGLVPVLKAEDAALRGDTADVLGQIAHAGAADALRALLDDSNADVAEIAEEAIVAIEERAVE